MLAQQISRLLTDTSKASYSELKTIVVSTFLISLILSFSLVLADSVVNSDGMLYIQAASFIQDGDWSSAVKTYNWLTYPYIIAHFSTLTSLSLEYSAYTLNALFTALTCTAFVLIVGELGGYKKSTLILAAIIVLCFPNLNEYRSMVVRDHGYWAFYSISCYLFFRCYLNPNLSLILLFVFSTCMATLFRAEGVAFLLLAPFITFQLNQKKKSNKNKHFASYLLFTFCILTLVVIWFLISESQIVGFSKVTTQLTSVKQKAFLLIGQDSIYLQEAKNFLNQLNPQENSEDYALAVLVLTFLVILISEILGSVSPLYVAGLGLSIYLKNSFPSSRVTFPWLVLTFINIVVLCAFLITHFFLIGRYPIALALTLLLPLPFLLQHLFTEHSPINTKSIKHRQLFYVLMFVFIALTLGSLTSFGAKKDYLKDAGLWLLESPHTNKKRVYSNSAEVIFYSKNFSTYKSRNTPLVDVLNKIKHSKLKKYDYLALKVSRKTLNGTNQLTQALGHAPLKIFANKRGDKVLIFSMEKNAAPNALK